MSSEVGMGQEDCVSSDVQAMCVYVRDVRVLKKACVCVY